MEETPAAAASNENDDFQKAEKQQQSTLTTVFTIWNLMVGASIIAMPYAFYQSGLLIGIILTFLSFIASMQSCIYIARTTKPGNDYYDTLKVYWGTWGFQLYIGGLVIILIAGTTGYFMIMSQMFQKCIIYLSSGVHFASGPRLDQVMPVIVFLATCWVCVQKELGIFIVIASNGAWAILAIVIAIICVGLYALGNTHFEMEQYPGAIVQIKGDTAKMLPMFNFNPGPLGGVLALGYHIHALVIPILQETSTPANYEKDIRYGFYLGFFTYLGIGVAGFYGFQGIYFNDYAATADLINRPIAQNCIVMFGESEFPAFVLNLIVVIFCSSSYPLLTFIVINLTLKMYKEHKGLQSTSDQDLLGKYYNFYAISINVIPFIITCVLPGIATVLGLVGSVFGFFILYIIPVITYLKMLKSEQNTTVGEEIEDKEGEMEEKNDDFVDQTATKKNLYCKECFYGAAVIGYGIAIFTITFYNPFKK